MKTSYVFLADGFEEVEALTCIDVMRRAAMPVVTVSINPDVAVTGAHGVTVMADSLFDDNDYSDAEWLVLPGGIPGAPNLAAHEALCDLLTAQDERGGKVGAICASPAVVLAPLGDGNVVTGNGPAAAAPFALEMVAQSLGRGAADQVAAGMLLA